VTYEEARARARPFKVGDLHELDEVIDRATKTHGWPAVIPQYSGASTWAWRQWSGTIIERLWRSALLSALVPLALMIGVHWRDPSVRWFGTPEETHHLIAPLLAVSVGFNHLLTLSTFVVTFFVGHRCTRHLTLRTLVICMAHCGQSLAQDE